MARAEGEKARLLAEALGNAAGKALGPEGAAQILAAAAAPLGSVNDIRIIDWSGSSRRPRSPLPLRHHHLAGRAQALGLGDVLAKYGVTSEILKPALEAVRTAEVQTSQSKQKGASPEGPEKSRT